MSRIVLTPEEATRLNDLINEKGLLDPPCEFCGQKRFQTNNILVFPPTLAIHEDGSLYQTIESGIMPCAAVTCGNCGNTKFFNTMILGFEPDKGESNG